MKATIRIDQTTVIVPKISTIQTRRHSHQLDRWQVGVDTTYAMVWSQPLTADEAQAERERIEKALEDWYAPAPREPQFLTRDGEPLTLSDLWYFDEKEEHYASVEVR